MKVKDLMEATQAARTAVAANRILEEALHDLAIEAFRRGETSGDIITDYQFCDPETHASDLDGLQRLVEKIAKMTNGRHVLIVHHSELLDYNAPEIRRLKEDFSAVLGLLASDHLKFAPDSGFRLLSLPIFWSVFPDFGLEAVSYHSFTIHPIHLTDLGQGRYGLSCLKHPVKRLVVKDGKAEPELVCDLTLFVGNWAIDAFCRNPQDLADWLPDESARRAWILEQAILLQEALPDDLK